MQTLSLIAPEVGGGKGPGTVVVNRAAIESRTATVPEVTQLEYQFDGWMGDDLLTASPCYIVTQRLADALTRSDLTGFRLADVQISTSSEWAQWKQLRPDLVPELPAFRWLVPDGRAEFTMDGTICGWSGDDLNWATCRDYVKPATFEEMLAESISPHGLVITPRCLELLRGYQISRSRVRELVLP
jgi:hypothetical protein